MTDSPTPTDLDLTAPRRSQLRALAHPLAPVVRVGQAGLTDAVLGAIDAALVTHELIKVRLDRPDDKRGLSRQLAVGSGSALVGLVGHTVTLYRPHPEGPPARSNCRQRAGQAAAGRTARRRAGGRAAPLANR